MSIVLVTPAVTPAHGEGQAGQAISVDGNGTGRVFDGVGAISGGGGTSRLLVDYPEPERNRILDYLFKPGYGASLQILKVEIGSDTNSSNGAEPSHERARGQVDCTAGYEWWLMEQAKKRNPAIKFYGLEWGAPGWFDGGFWSQDNITYLLNWLGCASQHGLTIGYLGGWNEKGWDKTWYENLRAALDQHGYQDVQLVAADNGGWNVATDMVNDPAFDAAVDVVGIHYPCSQTHCSSSADALSLDKPLFASEDGWKNYLTGAADVAAEINHAYIDSRMTAYINWPAAYAWYPTVQFQDSGLLKANEPWSGYYDLGPTLWVLAQTAQFTRPGWRYIDSATGHLDGGGTYVTRQSPSAGDTARSTTAGRDYTTVFETTAATEPQTVHVTVGGGLSTDTLHLWSTQPDSADPSTWFAQGDDVQPAEDGSYTITLQPDRVYTLTTMQGGKGAASSPPPATLTLPFRDSFDGYQKGSTPRYFSDMEGAFEIAPCGHAVDGTGVHAGKCLQQVITQQPTKWTRVPSPVTLVGDASWTDYQVSTKFLLQQPGTVSLLGRVVNELSSANKPHVNIWMGYYLNISDTGAWSLQDVQGCPTTQCSPGSNKTVTIAQGNAAAMGTSQWHQMALRFNGDTITVIIDGVPAATVTDPTYDHGQVGLMLDGEQACAAPPDCPSSYITAQFDDFAVTPS
ncbi:galactosylceramidase [Streptomyces brasiliensis]|uniref:galactosylceramidase n=1 Tax=Streptomyces brasiliensis TaxID=1954 RepID=UPI001671637D|nr:galactosylceramidase [Streptomyces brasiliensis]